MDTRVTISEVVILGDSLTDRGTMNERRLLGILPMSWFSGLSGKSPQGSFSNGYIWSDYLGASLANDITIRLLKEDYHLTDVDIMHAIMINDQRVLSVIKEAYTLANDKEIKYKGQGLVRTYAEGGMTSDNYTNKMTWNISKLFTRKILTNLDTMREKLFANDIENNITAEEKAVTLVIEWSGANDLITVNSKPTHHDVDRAIRSRMRNVELMYRAGYRNFTLFNMADLALTPRFQAMSLGQQMKISETCLYFNDQLSRHVQSIKLKHPDLNIHIYDIYRDMNMIYHNPTRYQLDPNKRALSFIESKDFKVDANGRSPSSGYIYWDKTGHITGDVQGLLTQEYLKDFKAHYNFKFELRRAANNLPQKNVLRRTL